MPENGPIKDLHLCESVEELDKMLEVSGLKGKKAKLLCDSARNLFRNAEEERHSGDEEKAYLYYMRYLRVVTYLQKAPDYILKKDYYNDMLGVSNPYKAIDHADKLKASLISRFDAVNKRKKIKDIEDQEKVKQKIDNERNKAKHSSTLPIINTLPALLGDKISCVELYTLLSNKISKQKIFIVDLRQSRDYADSHIVYSSLSSLYCLNVPEEIIVEGLSAKRLEEKFPSESKRMWSLRMSNNIIVMVDWSSHHLVPGTPLQIFKTIITKWDTEVKYDSEPLFLEGGYEEWLLHYPSYTTNAKAIRPNKTTIVDNYLQGIDYPEFIDTSSEDVNSHNRTSTQEANAPGVAANPVIDRSSKGAAIQMYSERAKQMQIILEEQVKLADTSLTVEKERVEAERDWKLTVAKEEEKDNLQSKGQEILYTILQLDNKQRDVALKKQDLSERYEEYRRKQREESARIREQENNVKPDLPSSGDEGTPTSDTEMPSDESYDEITKNLLDESKEKELRIKAMEEERAALNRERLEMEATRERMLTEVREKKKPVYKRQLEDGDTYIADLNDETTSSGMNRSHSSPSIAQTMEQDEPASNHNVPQFDRTAKPNYHSSVGADTNVIRQRDFQGVWGCPGKGLTGLKNLGNTCYMNSIIQCLNNTAILSSYFIEDAYRQHVNRNQTTRGAIAEEVAAVVKTLWSGQYKSIATRDLRHVIGKHQMSFRGFEQQDSHEFLTILMDWLHDDLQFSSSQPVHKDSLLPSEKAWHEYTKSKESLILRLFYGQIKSTVTCKICSKESVTYESFSNLSLELPGNTNKCSLSDCLKLYLKGETIIGWNCPSCKEKRDACKKLDISRLPPVLVIHFKRFFLDSKEYISNMYRKKQTYIDFPLNDLDMRPFSLDMQNGHNQVYSLYGVSNHYGSMEGGHYTAYCKSSIYSKWYKFDDHIVSDISPGDVKSSAAYILFYTSALSTT